MQPLLVKCFSLRWSPISKGCHSLTQHFPQNVIFGQLFTKGTTIRMGWSAAGAESQARALCRPSRSQGHLGLSRPFARKKWGNFFSKQSQVWVENKRCK